MVSGHNFEMIGGDLVKAVQLSQRLVGSCFALGDIAETFYLCHVKLKYTNIKFFKQSRWFLTLIYTIPYLMSNMHY